MGSVVASAGCDSTNRKFPFAEMPLELPRPLARPWFVHLRGGVVNINVDHVGHRIEEQIPHMFDDLRPGYPLAFIAHQVLQQTKLFRSEFDGPIGASHRVFHSVYLQVVHTQHGLLGTAATPQQRAHPRGKLHKRKGLQH
jgi:hypothetical protein